MSILRVFLDIGSRWRWREPSIQGTPAAISAPRPDTELSPSERRNLISEALRKLNFPADTWPPLIAALEQISGALGPSFNGDALRKWGDRLSPPEVKALGFRGGVVLGRRFIDALPPENRRDAINQACRIASVINVMVAARRDLCRISSLGSDIRVQCHANEMASGPCAACLHAAGRTFLAKEAPLPPFDGCPHPDQCSIRYMIRLDLD